MAVSNYRILSASSSNKLATLVTTAIAGGDQPIGTPVMADGGKLHQAIVTGSVEVGSGITEYASFTSRDPAVLTDQVKASINAGKQPYGGLTVDSKGNLVQVLTTGTLAGAGPSGVTTFLGLSDTPGVYTDKGNYLVAVNGAENALIFTAAPIPAPVQNLSSASGTIFVSPLNYSAIYIVLNDSASSLLDAATARDWQRVMFIFQQDSTGNRTINTGTMFAAGSGVSLTLSTAANAVDYWDCIRTGSGKYLVLSVAKGV